MHKASSVGPMAGRQTVLRAVAQVAAAGVSAVLGPVVAGVRRFSMPTTRAWVEVARIRAVAAEGPPDRRVHRPTVPLVRRCQMLPALGSDEPLPALPVQRAEPCVVPAAPPCQPVVRESSHCAVQMVAPPQPVLAVDSRQGHWLRVLDWRAQRAGPAPITNKRSQPQVQKERPHSAKAATHGSRLIKNRLQAVRHLPVAKRVVNPLEVVPGVQGRAWRVRASSNQPAQPVRHLPVAKWVVSLLGLMPGVQARAGRGRASNNQPAQSARRRQAVDLPCRAAPPRASGAQAKRSAKRQALRVWRPAAVLIQLRVVMNVLTVVKTARVALRHAQVIPMQPTVRQ